LTVVDFLTNPEHWLHDNGLILLEFDSRETNKRVNVVQLSRHKKLSLKAFTILMKDLVEGISFIEKFRGFFYFFISNVSD